MTTPRVHKGRDLPVRSPQPLDRIAKARAVGHLRAKLAIENLRAARLIYDKLPRYAK
jgi:hypothetical protein